MEPPMYVKFKQHLMEYQWTNFTVYPASISDFSLLVQLLPLLTGNYYEE